MHMVFVQSRKSMSLFGISIGVTMSIGGAQPIFVYVEPMFLVVNIHYYHGFWGKPAGYFQHFAPENRFKTNLYIYWIFPC